jgi:biotin synthase
MNDIHTIIHKDCLNRDDIVAILSASSEEAIELIRSRAEEILETHAPGKWVFFRGLIEFSNKCANDCLYCGIRASNASFSRYRLDEDEIVQCAAWAAGQGYGSIVLQSGELRDEGFIGFVEQVVRRIKSSTRSEKLPGGVGVTLSVGEQSPQTYRRFF